MVCRSVVERKDSTLAPGISGRLSVRVGLCSFIRFPTPHGKGVDDVIDVYNCRCLG